MMPRQPNENLPILVLGFLRDLAGGQPRLDEGRNLGQGARGKLIKPLGSAADHLRQQPPLDRTRI
jgi:hypothetical protein